MREQGRKERRMKKRNKYRGSGVQGEEISHCEGDRANNSEGKGTSKKQQFKVGSPDQTENMMILFPSRCCGLLTYRDAYWLWLWSMEVCIIMVGS